MQLFISYARESIEDVRDTVEILRAGGHSVWFDERLLPGQDWKEELGKAIDGCEAFVFALTHDSVGSDWCAWELATAASLDKAVIPVLLEPGVDIPPSVEQLQCADFTTGEKAIAVAKLMAALAAMQKIPADRSPEVPAHPQGAPSRAWEDAEHWTDALVPEVYQPKDDAEEVVDKFAANLMRGIEGVGGRMILTTQRILFEPHRINAQTDPLEVPLASIEEVGPTDMLGFVPTGISVRVRGGEEHRFVVWGRKRIIAKIEAARDRSRG